MKKHALLISLYELGRQSFGVASAAAFLQAAGATVSCQDLAIERLDSAMIAQADLIAIHLPMHTATRISVSVIQRIRQSRPEVPLCCFGLYAPLNAAYLRGLGVDAIIGGEFEEGLVEFFVTVQPPPELVEGLGGLRQAQPTEPERLQFVNESKPNLLIQLSKQRFIQPMREQLPTLAQYASLDRGDGIPHQVGYTETSRGCKHLCRHCPVVPVYEGSFRVVQKEIVLADIRQQVAAGAEHITFGDPDFFNGPGHGLAIVEAVHAEFPKLTYDVTIKVEHLLNHADHLSTLKQTGCLFIISAIESFDDHVLDLLQKGHTYADFLRARQLCLEHDICLQPTFVTFHPWLSVETYVDFLRIVADLNLIDSLSPIQYAIRLLIPTGSRLLELAEVQGLVAPFDEESLAYPWTHPDPLVDRLQEQILAIVQGGEERGESRYQIFTQVWYAATQALKTRDESIPEPSFLDYVPTLFAVPKLSEHWYC